MVLFKGKFLFRKRTSSLEGVWRIHFSEMFFAFGAGLGEQFLVGLEVLLGGLGVEIWAVEVAVPSGLGDVRVEVLLGVTAAATVAVQFGVAQAWG